MPVATMFLDYYELYDHFDRHGSDFQCSDESEYLQKCRNFLNADKAIRTDIQECERDKTNEIIRFSASTDEFAIMSLSGMVKTYYKPMPRHLAPAGYAGDTHAFLTNQLYFEDNCKR